MAVLASRGLPGPFDLFEPPPPGATVVAPPAGRARFHQLPVQCAQALDHHLLVVPAHRRDAALAQPFERGFGARASVDKVPDAEEPVTAGVERELFERVLERVEVPVQIADHEVAPIGVRSVGDHRCFGPPRQESVHGSPSSRMDVPAGM